MKRILNYLSLLTIIVLATSPMLAEAQGSMSYADTILDGNPFVYYRLDESLVTETVEDEMGAHDGAFQNNPTVGVTGAVVTDPTSTAVCFDGNQSQYIELTTLGDYGSGMTEGFTIEYWLKTTDPTAGQTILGSVHIRDVPEDPYFISNFFISIGDQDGSVRMYFRDHNWRRYNLYSYPEDRTVDIFDGQWHHMVHVYDPTGTLLEDRMILYVDGVRQTLEIQLLGGVPSDFRNFNVPMILGALNFRGEIRHHLNGCLDEVAFYDRPLSEEEVNSHFIASVSDIYGCIKLFGKPLANVEVHLHQKSTKLETMTDAEGCFQFLELPSPTEKFDIKAKVSGQETP